MDLQALIGQITIVDFMFTNCQGPCPIMSRYMTQLYQKYAGNDYVQFLSISVDPKRDTKAALQAYAQKQGVTDDRWTFARGDLEDIVKLSEEGFFLAADNFPMGHSTRFVLVDSQARIRAYFDGVDPEEITRLEETITQLSQEENPS